MKRFLSLLVVVLLIIQLFRPTRNISHSSQDYANDISVKYPLSDSIKSILQTSCYDCHSNNTSYPWYSNIQPVAWWLNHHINEGKREVNFSEFSGYSIRRQYRKYKEIGEQVKEGEMPLSSYTLIHKNAILTASQQSILENWATANMKNIEANYPPDSLKKK